MAFCPKCGTQLEEGARFCPSCGTPLATNQASGVGDPKYQQLGGWLLFFTIGWGLSALQSVGNVIDLLGSLGAIMRYGYGARLILPALLSIVTSLMSGAIGVLMVVLIIKRNQQFLRFYQILTIAELALTLLSALVVSTTGVAAFASLTGVVFGGGVGLFLVTLYFCKSVRVRTYMGSTAYLDLALFKVGVS